MYRAALKEFGALGDTKGIVPRSELVWLI